MLLELRGRLLPGATEAGGHCLVIFLDIAQGRCQLVNFDIDVAQAHQFLLNAGRKGANVGRFDAMFAGDIINTGETGLDIIEALRIWFDAVCQALQVIDGFLKLNSAADEQFRDGRQSCQVDGLQ